MIDLESGELIGWCDIRRMARAVVSTPARVSVLRAPVRFGSPEWRPYPARAELMGRRWLDPDPSDDGLLDARDPWEARGFAPEWAR
jgi:hypothetical protein